MHEDHLFKSKGVTSFLQCFFFVTAIVPVSASCGSGRPGGGGATAALATATTATVSTATTVSRPAGLYTSAIRYQCGARGSTICERINSGRTAVLRRRRAVGRVPRPRGAARAAAGATAAPAAHSATRRAASEWPGTVCDPLLRPRLARNGRPQRYPPAAGVAGRRAGAAPVPARARAPRRLRRAAAGAAAAATAAW